jgi:putative YhbY family RNA-binding protein
MTRLELSTAERRQKRADAHHLAPVVIVGAEGLSEAVRKEVDRALAAHGLIKVRVFSDDRANREALLAQLCDGLGAAPVQHIGKLLVLWRPIPPKAVTAEAPQGPGMRTVKLVKFAKSGSHRPTVRKVQLAGNQRVTAGGMVKRKDPKRSGTALSSKKRSGA